MGRRTRRGAASDTGARVRTCVTATTRIVIACAALVAIGCSRAFDLEAARRVLAGTPESETPVLFESPASDVPPPAGLRAVAHELREVPLAWDPPSTPRMRGIVIERALSADGPFERIAVLVEPYDTSYIDRGFDLARKAKEAAGEAGLGDGAAYYYRLRAFDSTGHVGATPSPVALARTAPPPPPPGELRTFSQLPRKVALSWSAAESSLVAGYVVMRSPSPSGPFDVVARIPGRHHTSYVDGGLGDLRVFHYRVAAVNPLGGIGPPTEPVRAVTKAEPLPPAGLRVESVGAGGVALRWEPNAERDITRYRVEHRTADDDAFEEVVTVDAVRFDPPAEHRGGQWRVLAIDGDGLESEPSAPVEMPSPSE